MNTKTTKEFVTKHGIVTIKADKAKAEKEIDDLLERLGNTSGAIPFYAIFPKGRPNEPILLDGILTQQQIIDTLQRAISPGVAKTAAATADPVN